MTGSYTDILCRGPHTDIIESAIIEGGTDSHRHEFNQAFTCGTTQLVHQGSGELWPAVTVDALALIQEDSQTFFGLGRQRVLVTLCELVIGSLIRDQRRLIKHQRQAPEQRKIGFHLSITAGSDFL